VSRIIPVVAGIAIYAVVIAFGRYVLGIEPTGAEMLVVTIAATLNLVVYETAPSPSDPRPGRDKENG
jgi:hypothetical protein